MVLCDTAQARTVFYCVLLHASHPPPVFRQGTCWACLTTNMALLAEGHSTDILWLIQQKGNIGSNAAQAQAWAVLPADKEAVLSLLTQAGSNGERYQK